MHNPPQTIHAAHLQQQTLYDYIIPAKDSTYCKPMPEYTSTAIVDGHPRIYNHIDIKCYYYVSCKEGPKDLTALLNWMILNEIPYVELTGLDDHTPLTLCKAMQNETFLPFYDIEAFLD